jgi:hypothetical protein
MKKHLITNSSNDSTIELSSLVEKSKQNEVVMREDETHYDTIKSYTDGKIDNYVHMMNKIDNALEYFSNSSGYKKEKLDSLMQDFITNLTKY